MNTLANTYSDLGRHQDALALLEKTLEFRRRVLPENHPHIGMTCFNLSASYRQSGNLHRAVEAARQAARIFQLTLPPSHPNLQNAQKRVREIEDDICRRA